MRQCSWSKVVLAVLSCFAAASVLAQSAPSGAPTFVATYTNCSSATSEAPQPKTYPPVAGMFCRYQNSVTCTVTFKQAGFPALTPIVGEINGVQCPAIPNPQKTVYVCPSILACTSYVTPPR